MSDAEAVADEIEGYVTGLLALVGVNADPLASREHILLSNLIQHSWHEGRELDLMTLVGMIPTPPIRKLGVFELDQFFPADDRMKLAMKLNGLLASPSFASWAQGPPLDIDAMLFDASGKGRCAIVTTAHLSDDERQFVTSLILAKLVTWMRRQSGTTDLRAMLYMDEVAGYLPPTAMPPTKKPIMTLMKQARAFGVGVILSTRNPVDVDYKAMSNAGTWMIGRLQTDRDKARLLDGMASAAGSVDVAAIDATISGLAKREFVLRQAGKDQPEVFTTRWAMSYLRGPMTRDQIALVSPQVEAAAPPAPSPPTLATAAPAGLAPPTPGAAPAAAVPPPPVAPPATAAPAPSPATAPAPAIPSDQSVVAPKVADGVAVRWVDVAAPWLGDVGGDSCGTVMEAAVVARVAIRYDEAKADLVHDEEFEAVLFPLTDPADVTKLAQVDYDDRDLRTEAPAGVTYRLPDARIATKTFFNDIERDLRDHLTRTLSLEIPSNAELKLYGRPGETEAEFAARCERAADDLADADIAKLRDKYETRATKLRDQIDAAQDRADVLAEQAKGAKRSELLSTAGSLLGGLLGGSKSKTKMAGDLLGDAGTAARRRGSGAARQLQRVGPSGRCRREQGGAPGGAGRGTRGRTRRRRQRDRRAVGYRSRGDHPNGGGPGAHRRQGHASLAGLDSGGLKPPDPRGHHLHRLRSAAAGLRPESTGPVAGQLSFMGERNDSNLVVRDGVHHQVGVAQQSNLAGKKGAADALHWHPGVRKAAQRLGSRERCSREQRATPRFALFVPTCRFDKLAERFVIDTNPTRHVSESAVSTRCRASSRSTPCEAPRANRSIRSSTVRAQANDCSLEYSGSRLSRLANNSAATRARSSSGSAKPSLKTLAASVRTVEIVPQSVHLSRRIPVVRPPSSWSSPLHGVDAINAPLAIGASLRSVRVAMPSPPPHIARHQEPSPRTRKRSGHGGCRAGTRFLTGPAT